MINIDEEENEKGKLEMHLLLTSPYLKEDGTSREEAFPWNLVIAVELEQRKKDFPLSLFTGASAKTVKLLDGDTSKNRCYLSVSSGRNTWNRPLDISLGELFQRVAAAEQDENMPVTVDLRDVSGVKAFKFE